MRAAYASLALAAGSRGTDPSSLHADAGSRPWPNEWPSTSSSVQLSSLPPGFQFKPKDQEIVTECLAKKVQDESMHIPQIHEVDIYQFSPLYLSQNYPHCGGEEKKWYFFTPRNRIYPNGKRPKRSIDGIGHWNATGADTLVPTKGELVGRKRVLVFYEGKPKCERKTSWIMHEYVLNAPSNSPSPNNMRLDDWVLCRIYDKDEKLRANRRRNHTNDVDYDMIPSAPFDPAPAPVRTVPSENSIYNDNNNEVEGFQAIIDAQENTIFHTVGQNDEPSMMDPLVDLLDSSLAGLNQLPYAPWIPSDDYNCAAAGTGDVDTWFDKTKLLGTTQPSISMNAADYSSVPVERDLYLFDSETQIESHIFPSQLSMYGSDHGPVVTQTTQIPHACMKDIDQGTNMEESRGLLEEIAFGSKGQVQAEQQQQQLIQDFIDREADSGSCGRLESSLRSSHSQEHSSSTFFTWQQPYDDGYGGYNTFSSSNNNYNNGLFC